VRPCRRACRERRDSRRLERARGDDRLIGDAGAVAQFDDEAVVARADGQHLAAELDRQLELLGVAREVVHDVVPAGIRVGVARERQSGQAVVAGRREQPQ
jgi:hypothetical protein